MATYEEVKILPNHPEKYLIDVRGKELHLAGAIPTSINVPFAELESALNMSDADFKAAFNRQKPNLDSCIIFHCNSGGRAQRAADYAQERGYINAVCYPGSWKEWKEKEGIN